MFVFTVENISNIKGLTYTNDGISDKHLERIEYSKTSGLLKDFNYSEYMIKTPPKNNSIQTYEELKFLSYLPEDIEFVKAKEVQLDRALFEPCLKCILP